MIRKAKFLCISCVLVFVPAYGMADVITFEDLAIDRLDLAGPQTEGLFTYEATVGEGWEVITEIGDPPSSLTTFFNNEGAFPGDTVDITLSGGGFFTFNFVDFRTISSTGSDFVEIIGFAGAFPTDTLTLNTSTTSFQTVASGFSSSIELLRVRVTRNGSNALLLDNFDLTPTSVPEPSTLFLLGTGLVGLVARARRKKS